MPICTFYLSNRCRHGKHCRFYHPTNADATSLNNTNTNNIMAKNSLRSREFDPYKAKAIQMAKTQQDLEPRPYLSLRGPFFSIDVECVATGYGHTKRHRYPSRIALVKSIDGDVETVLDEWVNLSDVKVISYMSALTGTSEVECLHPNAKVLDEIRSMVKDMMPSDAILVGHSIEHDIHWLGLEKGIDFKDFFCTSVIFRQRLPKNLGSATNSLRTAEANEFKVGSNAQAYKSDIEDPDDRNLPFPTRYRIFSLRHCCINLLNVDIQGAAHDPVMDAKYSLILFEKYKDKSPSMLRAVRDSLHRVKATASFASENPVVDGVCLSPFGYKMKASARKIWRWWVSKKTGIQ